MDISIPDELSVLGVTSKDIEEKKSDLSKSVKFEVKENDVIFQNYDLLLTPVQPLPAFKAGIEFPEDHNFKRWHEWTPFTNPFNLLQSIGSGQILQIRNFIP